MDYESKYKEALERAKDYVEKQNPPVNILCEIFPELAESEDERIRKDLIGFFKDDAFLYHKKEEIIAWLEKQKPVEWSEEDAFKTHTLRDVVVSGGTIRMELRDEYVDWINRLKERLGGKK